MKRKLAWAIIGFVGAALAAFLGKIFYEMGNMSVIVLGGWAAIAMFLWAVHEVSPD
jgi:hypothetical protein